MAKDSYLISVADAVVRDVASDQLLFKGKALIDAALKETIATQEIRGGFGNALQYVFSHDKKLDVSLNSSTFEMAFISLNNGTSIANSLKDVYAIDEVVTLVGGSGTVVNAPIGSINVQKSDGTSVTVTPTGSNFTVTGGANTVVKCTYRYNATVDNITIDAGSSPNSYELTLSARVYDANSQIANLQIRIPSWKIAGTFDLAFSASAASTSKLDGMALADAFGNLAYVTSVPVGGGVTSYQAIAATPSTPTLTVASPTVQIATYGLRSGAYSNVLLNPSTDVTYVSATPATCTVSSAGVIQRVAVGTSLITVTATVSGLKDYINVTCT